MLHPYSTWLLFSGFDFTQPGSPDSQLHSCVGCFSFHLHCKVVAAVGNHHGDRGFQRVGSKGAEVARVAPSPELSGHSHCPVALGSVPSAAHPSSSDRKSVV